MLVQVNAVISHTSLDLHILHVQLSGAYYIIHDQIRVQLKEVGASLCSCHRRRCVVVVLAVVVVCQFPILLLISVPSDSGCMERGLQSAARRHTPPSHLHHGAPAPYDAGAAINNNQAGTEK